MTSRTPQDPPGPAVRLHDVRKVYGTREAAVTALGGVSLDFGAGTFTAVMGPSGSGKSTLLHCAAGLDRPTSGAVYLGGQDLARLSESQLTVLRRSRIGFVFQSFNLLPALSAELNVALPVRLDGRRPARREVREALAAVGLADRAGHKPSELSGGQQQRVAVARALITRPQVLFADEPTGALDSATGREVLTLLRSLVDDQGQTVVMVTHDPVIAAYADRVVFLADGVVTDEMHRPSAAQIATRMTTLEVGARAARPASGEPGPVEVAPPRSAEPGPVSSEAVLPAPGPGPADTAVARPIPEPGPIGTGVAPTPGVPVVPPTASSAGARPAPADRADGRFFGAVRRTGLVRSDRRWLGGVCGGLAERFVLSPALVRVVVVVASLLLFGLGVVPYALAWALLPDARDGRIPAQERWSRRTTVQPDQERAS